MVKKKTKKKDKTSELYAEVFASKMVFLEKHKSDTTSLMLRGHLVIEYYLDELTSIELKSGYLLDKANLSFFQKLCLVRSLNTVSTNYLDAIEKLNKVRNNCAHDLEYNISDVDLDKIGAPIIDEYSNIKTKHKRIEDKLVHVLGEIIVTLAVRCELSMDKRGFKK